MQQAGGPVRPLRAGESQSDTDTGRWFEFDPTPIILAGPDGQVLEINPAGERVIGEVASLDGGCVTFADPSARQCFSGALAALGSRRFERVSIIVRCDDGFWRRISIMRSGWPEPDAVFVILHGAERRDSDISALASAFGLTAAERRVLELLARGASAKNIAVQLGVSPHTVRVHMRNLYGKANVRGQCDLVREYTRLTS
jgi:DNA-binding CsgD family transcriptional regulator